MLEILKDMARFVGHRKKYVLIPIFIVFVLVGALIVLAQGSVVAPFIYTIF